MSVELSDAQRKVLKVLCDTFFPSVRKEDDPTGFWRRKASDLGVDKEMEGALQGLPNPQLQGALDLLNALAAKGFATADQFRREKMLTEVRDKSPAFAGIITYFQKQSLAFTYGLPATPVPDENHITYGSPDGQNPNWEILGYPGPVSVPPKKPKQIQTVTPSGDSQTMEADVCIAGSGAGGSVVAARMAALGKRVVVLEAGGHYNSADFHQLELWGYKHLWYRGGATPTANGTVAMLAGGTLGGGTEINWMNCVRTPDVVRRNWVQEFGLTGVDGPQFTAYIDTVSNRLSASHQTAYYNSQNLRMREGCQKLGYLTSQTFVNWDPNLFNPLMAGYTGFGDQTGGKQTARRTWLLDAYKNGARIVINCQADRILVENGRATGIAATYTDEQGKTTKLTVKAPQVVVACGSLESPALLLRTGIGGPAVGKNLHLQPGGAIYGVYKDKQKGWWGSPMTANCEQFTDTGGGFGFYMEIPAFGPGFVASVIPWAGGRQHKELMAKVPYISTFIWFLRDRGSGEVTIDGNGNSVATYQLSDEVDQKNFRSASAAAIRIHEAAGAKQIMFSLAHDHLTWTRGQDLEAFIARISRQPLLDGAQPMISAHQLSSCRLGRDPSTCVADTNGELHDVKGVWVADASACPTALGANPMITIMALAERTADKMIEAQQPGRAAAASASSTGIASTVSAASAGAATMISGAMDLMTAPLKMMALPLKLMAAGQQLVAEATSMMSHAATTHNGPKTSSGSRSSPMYSHIIELTAKEGQASAVVAAIRDKAIPQVISSSEGFIDEIVLISGSDPNRVVAISFWRSKADGDRFFATGFARVSQLLAPDLAVGAPVQHEELVVGSSTNTKIIGCEP